MIGIRDSTNIRDCIMRGSETLGDCVLQKRQYFIRTKQSEALGKMGADAARSSS